MRERSPDEDIFDSLEVALTRIDSSDEEPLVRPTIGRNVLRKVGVNSDSVPLLSSQVARRHGNRFEASADSSAAPDPASESADQGRHAEPLDASPRRVHAQFDLTEGDSDRSIVQEEGHSTKSDTESCGVVGRPVRRLRLMWRQDQHEVPLSVDSHDQRLASCAPTIDPRGSWKTVPGDGSRGAGSRVTVREFGPTGWRGAPGCSCAASH